MLIPETDVIHKAIIEARIWQAANSQPGNQSQMHPRPHPPTLHEDCTLYFIDRAWMAERKLGGMGRVFKDSRGLPIAKGSQSSQFVPSALVAEALALRFSLQAAHTEGFTSLQVFSDSENLANTLRLGDDSIEIADILHDIRGLVTLFSSISFFCIPRSTNFEAGALAKMALSISNPPMETPFLV